MLVSVASVRACATAVAVVVVVTGCHVLHASPKTGLAVVLAALVTAGPVLAPRHGPLLGVTGWAFLTGFVVHAGGVLTFEPADVRRAVVLLLAACLPSLLVHSRPMSHRVVEADRTLHAARSPPPLTGSGVADTVASTCGT